MLTLALNSVMTNLLVVFFLVVCVAMILIVLIQRPQGGGLSGAFGSGGGAGAGQTAFGTKTGDVLTWGTVSVFFIYLVVAVVLNFVARPDTSGASSAPALITPESQTEPPPAEEPPSLPALEGETPADVPAETPADLPADDTDATEDDAPTIDPASAESPV